VTNTLAYDASVLITTVISFIVEAPEVSPIKFVIEFSNQNIFLLFLNRFYSFFHFLFIY